MEVRPRSGGEGGWGGGGGGGGGGGLPLAVGLHDEGKMMRCVIYYYGMGLREWDDVNFYLLTWNLIIYITIFAKKNIIKNI